MFKQRLLSGIVLVILALIFIIHGGYLLLAVCGIISLIGLYELYRVFKIEKSLPGLFGYIGAVVFYLNQMCIRDRLYVSISVFSEGRSSR